MVGMQLVAVNKNLRSYHEAWHQYVDAWIVIQVPDLKWVFDWRLQVDFLPPPHALFNTLWERDEKKAVKPPWNVCTELDMKRDVLPNVVMLNLVAEKWNCVGFWIG